MDNNALRRDRLSNDYDPPVAKDARLPAVRVEDWMRDALDEIAESRPDASLADIVREAIREYLERHQS